MNRRVLWAIIAVVAVLVVILLLANQNNNQVSNQSNTTNTAQREDSSDNTTDVIPANTNSTQTNPETQPPISEPNAPQDPDIAVFEIAYNGTSFSPSQLTIKAGDVVIFKNESDKSFWPASGPHPQHTNYPEFDPKKAIPAGQDWQFKFEKSGTWPFHDHLNSSVTGRITVQ